MQLAESKNITFISYQKYIDLWDKSNKNRSDFISIKFDSLYMKVNKDLFPNTTALNQSLLSVQDSIEKAKISEGDIFVDVTNIFVLSIVNIFSSFFTFNLRNFTGNWEEDMKIFFFVIKEII